MKATIKCVGDVFRQETPIPMVRHEHDEAGETQGQEPEEALHTQVYPCVFMSDGGVTAENSHDVGADVGERSKVDQQQRSR